MRIVDIMSEALIVSDLAGTTRDAALDEIVRHVSTVVEEVDGPMALRVLIERERIGSTGVGDGIAIPHAKLAHLSRPVACLGRSRAGVVFNSLDGRPTHLLLALLIPEGQSGLHLKALARGSRLLKNGSFRNQLMSLRTPAEIWQALHQRDTSEAFNEEA